MRRTCLNNVYDLSKSDERIFFVGFDSGYETLSQFKNDFPERFFMEGFSEAHDNGMAAELSPEGNIATFLTRRCIEQTALDLYLHNVPVRLIGNGRGHIYAPLGPTHLATDDLAIRRTLPRMTILAPTDAEKMKRFMPLTADHPGPIYIRLAKGGDALVISTGEMLQHALYAADRLSRMGIRTTVLHVPTVKSLDHEAVLKYAEPATAIVTIEEYTLQGRLGSTVTELILEKNFNTSKKFKHIGFPDPFPVKYGSQAISWKYYGLTSKSNVNSIKKLLNDRHSFVGSSPAHMPDKSEQPSVKQMGNKNTNIHGGRVVFISDDPRVRQAKMGYALRSAGWEVILLHKQQPNFNCEDYFDSTHMYRDPGEALTFAQDIPANAYHVFSIWADLTSVKLIQNKPGKIVYDYWDTVEGITTATNLVPIQRFCMENADGLCCRDMRGPYLINSKGYRRPRHLILFPDFCWNMPLVKKKSLNKDGAIHLVVCGSIGIEKKGETDNGYLDIAKRFVDKGIHLHIYPHPTQKPINDVFSEYIALADQTSFLHFHEPIPMRSVIDELSKYHVGVTITRALTYGSPLVRYAPWYIQNCGSARLFDYIDAGLPVIMNKELHFQYSLLNRFGLTLDASPEMLTSPGSFLKNFLISDLSYQTEMIREKYSVKNKIEYLIRFYKDL